MRHVRLTFASIAVFAFSLSVPVSFCATIGSWDSVLAKAKEEGSVNVAGPGTATARRSLTKPFEDRYGIRVEYEGGRSSSLRSKFLSQRAAGLFEVDLWIAGFGTVQRMDTAQVFEPLEPALLLPDVKSPNTWSKGFLWHNPKQRRFFAFAARLFGGLADNPQLVKNSAVTSFQDLMDPRYKGKIISDDPRVPGVGQGFFTYLYLGKEFGFGPEFIQKLIKEQGIVFTRNARQAADWVAKGRYLLWPAPNQRVVVELKGKGVSLVHRCVEGGQWLSVGSGAVGMFTNAPHPNAAVVYLNWLLSKEGQASYSKGGDTASRRLDVPAPIEPCFVPKPDGHYFWVDTPEALKTRRAGGKLQQFLKSEYKRK